MKHKRESRGGYLSKAPAPAAAQPSAACSLGTCYTSPPEGHWLAAAALVMQSSRGVTVLVKTIRAVYIAPAPAAPPPTIVVCLKNEYCEVYYGGVLNKLPGIYVGMRAYESVLCTEYEENWIMLEC